jgi:hypothetical protein
LATVRRDIRIVRLDEDKDQIQLTNRIGWLVETGIGEEWASLDKLFEATVSLHDLLDESMIPDERIKLVQWTEVEVQRVAKETETSEDGKSKRSVITKNWNRLDNPMQESEKAATSSNDQMKRDNLPNSRKQPSDLTHVDYKGCYGCSKADVERVIRRLNESR